MKTGCDCIGEAGLRDHLQSRLSPPEEARVIAHLDTCPICQETLESFADSGSGLLEAAKRMGQRDVGPRTVPEELLRELEPTEERPPAADELADYLDAPATPGHLGRIGHYAVLSIAGQGGMGIALKAMDEKLGRTVCLKVLGRALAASHTARRRFMREARAAAAIRSDHVVTVYAVDEHRGRPYMAMEFVRGCSLEEELRRRGPLPPEEVIRIGREVAKGLSAAHECGLVHRDVKPANVLLEEGSRRAKITDFGLVRAMDGDQLTYEGVVAGTPEYMSPEQARGASVGLGSDLFSLGSVLYCMCTGRSPFAADNNVAVLKRICDEPAPAIRDVRPDVPDSLAQVIARLHARQPGERPASAAEAESLLAACLRAPGAALDSHRQLGRREWLAMSGSTVLVGGIFAGLIGWRRPWISRDQGATSVQGWTAASSPPSPANPLRWPPRLLLIVPSRDFFYPDYGPVYSQLSMYGVECSVASTTLTECQPNAPSPQIPVQPDLLLSDARGADYEAIYFCGGEGIEEFCVSGAAAAEARRLIDQALAAGRIVAAAGMGVVVLAEANALRGRRAACYPYGSPPGAYARRIQMQGAVCSDEGVVEDGLILTARAPQDIRQFSQLLLRRLGAEPPARGSPD